LVAWHRGQVQSEPGRAGDVALQPCVLIGLPDFNRVFGGINRSDDAAVSVRSLDLDGDAIGCILR